MHSSGGAGGFTLTELMIAVVVVGILAAIAVPAYTNYIREANRVDAQTALLALANEQEKQYPNANTYVSNLATLGRTATGSDFLTDKGLSALSVNVASEGDAFTLTATAVAGGSQAKDTACTVMTINSANQRQPATCWGR